MSKAGDKGALVEGNGGAASPEPLFDGGPKAPTEGVHKPFHWLSWGFHVMRYEHLGDRYYNPWKPKHLKSCQRIWQEAREDRDEIRKRLGNLLLYHKINPEYWSLTPERLLNRWDDLHTPPADAVGGRHAIRKRAEQHGQEQARRYIKERYGSQTR